MSYCIQSFGANSEEAGETAALGPDGLHFWMHYSSKTTMYRFSDNYSQWNR